VEMVDCHQLNNKQMISISVMLPSGSVRWVSLNCGKFVYCSTKYQADDLNIGDASFRERSSGESQLWKCLTV
jgi:hypothetical protein